MARFCFYNKGIRKHWNFSKSVPNEFSKPAFILRVNVPEETIEDVISSRIAISVSLSSIACASGDKSVKYNAWTYTSVHNLDRIPKPLSCTVLFSKVNVLGTETPFIWNSDCAITSENWADKDSSKNRIIYFVGLYIDAKLK